jgi:hypothetical protein
VRKDHHDRLNEIIDDAEQGRVGRDVTALKLRDHFDRHGFSMTDVDKRGRVVPAELKSQNCLDHHPVGKPAALAIASAPFDTHEEKERELEKLGSSKLSHDHGGDAEGIDKSTIIRKGEATVCDMVRKFARPNRNFADAYDELYREREAFRKTVALSRVFV